MNDPCGWELVRESIRRGDSCHMCGRTQPGNNEYDYPRRRGWEGWEIKNDAGVHIRHLPDLPENLCKCTGRTRD